MPQSVSALFSVWLLTADSNLSFVSTPGVGGLEMVAWVGNGIKQASVLEAGICCLLFT